MGVSLIVSARSSKNGIVLDDWLAFVKQERDLRVRTEPFTIAGPNGTISVDPLLGQAEIVVDGERVPFLGFHRGRLTMNYSSKLEVRDNPVRRKIAQVAKQFSAIITTDAGDDILDW